MLSEIVNLFFIILLIPLIYPLGSSSFVSFIISPVPELYITLSVIKLRSERITRAGPSDKTSLPIRSLVQINWTGLVKYQDLSKAYL